MLILDRSVDMAAVLVHEYTYEAAAYDLLDQEGGMLDIDHNVVSQQGKEQLLSDADPIWEELKHLHIDSARQRLVARVQQVRDNTVSRDAGGRDIGTDEMLEMLRKTPEQRDTMNKLMLHLTLLEQVTMRIKEEELHPGQLGLLEQDIACGIDMSGKDVKADRVQEKMTRILKDPAVHLSGESTLRLLMLFFTCFANIAEPLRRQLMEFAQLSGEDQDILMAMLRTKLMEVPSHQRHKVGGSGCVHRVTREQAARFKQNARAEDSIVLSRFEPRIKGLIEQLWQDRLSAEDFPFLEGSNAANSSSARAVPSFGSLTPGPSPQRADKEQWSFASWDQTPGCGGAGKASAPQEITQRMIIFVIGGITHSELRAAAEVRTSLPRGSEVVLGGTAVLTPRRLMRVLRPRGGDSTRTAVVDDRLDLA